MLKNLFKKFIFEIFLIIILVFMYKDYFPVWIKEWSDLESFYGLGFFIIGFNIYFIKTNWSALKEIPKASSPIGLILILISVLLYIIGFRGNMDYAVNLSFPMLISGVILAIYGFELLKKLLMPIFLSALILPIFPLHRLTMPLQLISTKISSEVLTGLGINSFNEGSILYVNHFRLSVVAGCSGLKSLTSLVFVSAIASYFEKVSRFKALFYLLLTFPLAIFMNVVRISITALYGLYNGNPGLEQFHDYLGLVINAISIALLIFIIRTNEKKAESL